MLIRILLASFLMILLCLLPAQMLPAGGYLRFALFLIPYLVIGYDILKKAVKGIVNRQVFDENFLMELCGGKEQEKYKRADGYPSRLCQRGA